jgi:hypothetical protein
MDWQSVKNGALSDIITWGWCHRTSYLTKRGCYDISTNRRSQDRSLGPNVGLLKGGAYVFNIYTNIASILRKLKSTIKSWIGTRVSKNWPDVWWSVTHKQPTNKQNNACTCVTVWNTRICFIWELFSGASLPMELNKMMIRLITQYSSTYDNMSRNRKMLTTY